MKDKRYQLCCVAIYWNFKIFLRLFTNAALWKTYFNQHNLTPIAKFGVANIVVVKWCDVNSANFNYNNFEKICTTYYM